MKKLIFTLLLTLSYSVFAQEVTPVQTSSEDTSVITDIVPLGDVVDATISVVKDGKSMSKLALSVAVLNLIVLFLKTNLANNWFSKKSSNYKRVILLILGQVLGILLAIEGGLSPLSAVIAGLITSGGAIAIFESVKTLLPKK